MANGKLTPKQEAFVREYLVDLNGSAAYRRAGYKVKNEAVARAAAARLLADVNVKAAVAAAKESRAKRTLVTADRVVREMAVVGFSDVDEIMDLDTMIMRQGIRKRARRAISSVRVKRTTYGSGNSERREDVVEFKLWSKTAALDMLAKHTGVYPEKGTGAADEEPEFQQEE